MILKILGVCVYLSLWFGIFSVTYSDQCGKSIIGSAIAATFVCLCIPLNEFRDNYVIKR